MRVVLLLPLVVLALTALSCTGNEPAPSPAPTVESATVPTPDISAAVEAGIAATKEAEASIEATVTARVKATKGAEPTPAPPQHTASSSWCNTTAVTGAQAPDTVASGQGSAGRPLPRHGRPKLEEQHKLAERRAVGRMARRLPQASSMTAPTVRAA